MAGRLGYRVLALLLPQRLKADHALLDGYKFSSALLGCISYLLEQCAGLH
jgi:hypothetical protein